LGRLDFENRPNRKETTARRVTNLRVVAKNAISHGLLIAIALVFTIGGTHLLPAEEYGELRYAMTLLPLFMAFSLPDYDRIILRNAHLRKRVPLLEMFYVRAAAGLLGSVLILGVVCALKEQINPVQYFVLLWIGLLLPLFETGTGYRTYLIGTGLRDAGLNRVIQARLLTLILLGASLFLIYAFGVNRVWIFPAYLLSLIVPTLLIFFSVALRQRARPTRPLSSIARLDVRAAAVATCAGMIYTLAFSLDKLLVRQYQGSSALAMYAILIMGPQELSKLFDATLPLFYRKLFFAKKTLELHKQWIAGLLVLAATLAYIVIFYRLSGFVFGARYRYPLHSVILSGIMIGSASFEYLNTHRVFAILGPRQFLQYAVVNLIANALMLPAALAAGGIDGLMIGLIVKQLLTPTLFFARIAAFRHGYQQKQLR
jgi:hypothetical protein